MEILHRGTAPSERVHEATCNSCKTKVRFTQGEAKYNSDQREGDYLSVSCPVCHNIITKALHTASNTWSLYDR